MSSLSWPSSGAGPWMGRRLSPCETGCPRMVRSPRAGEWTGFVHPVDRPAGDARVVEDLDPRRAVLLPGDRHEHLHQHMAVGGAGLRVSEAQIGTQIGPLDGAAQPLIEL